MDNNDDFNLLDLLERSYHQFDDQNNNDPSSIGIKHKYASSVSTQSTTQSRRPPAPKKRREQHQQQQQQQLQQLQQQQEQQQQHTPLLNDDNVSLSAFNPDHNPGGYDIQPQEQPENAGLTFSPSSFQDSGVSSPDDINEWLRHDDEENILKLMTLQRQLTDLQQVLLEKEQELELYRQYMHFPIQFVKERARQTYDQEKEKGNEIDNLSIDIILSSLLRSPSKPTENVSLPFAVKLFQQEWVKKSGKKSSHNTNNNNNKKEIKPTEKLALQQVNTENQSESHQDTPSIVTWGKHSSNGSAIYISAASTTTSSSRSFMAMSATTGSRIHMIAGTLNEKVDTDARQSLFDQYINGTISQQSSPSITSLANSPNNNTSNNNNSNSVEDNITSSDTKLTEVEILAVKEAAKQCFMSFDGKMIIESESDRLEYLQEHCHGLSPSSLSIAADYFKQELEKVRNKTKKQLLRFQNYNTEKWDQPIGRVCYLILGKSRWEKLSDREKILITGKYAFLRKHLEDLKKRNAKIKWDKLQDQFERTVNAHGPDNWDLFCGYWLSLDQERYERRKEWESSSSKAPAPATVSNPPIYSSSSLPVGDINADPTSTALLDYNDLQFLNHHHHHQQQQQQIHHLI